MQIGGRHGSTGAAEGRVSSHTHGRNLATNTRPEERGVAFWATVGALKRLCGPLPPAVFSSLLCRVEKWVISSKRSDAAAVVCGREGGGEKRWRTGASCSPSENAARARRRNCLNLFQLWRLPITQPPPPLLAFLQSFVLRYYQMRSRLRWSF